MKQQTIWAVVRKCLPEFVIGVAVCGGGMMLLVDPLQSRLADAQQYVGTLQRTVAGFKTSPSALVEAQAKVQEAHRALEEIQARSEIVADRTEMFSALMNLAEDAGVRVNQFQPSTPRPPKPPAQPAQTTATPAPTPQPRGAQGARALLAPPQAPPPQTPKPTFDTRVAYALSVQGAYPAIARFINALEQNVGFSVVRSIRILPTTDPSVLLAQIETEHVAIDTKAFLQAQAEANAHKVNQGGQP
jgi:hypothetical protein